MMEVVVTTGAIRHAKLQPNHQVVVAKCLGERSLLLDILYQVLANFIVLLIYLNLFSSLSVHLHHDVTVNSLQRSQN